MGFLEPCHLLTFSHFAIAITLIHFCHVVLIVLWFRSLGSAFVSGFLCGYTRLQISAVAISCVIPRCTMSHSDRSRSPTSRRSGSALSRADLPGFPVWRGPMGQAVRAAQAMSHPQNTPKWSGPMSGTYHLYSPQMHVRPLLHSTSSQSHPFPPTPLTQRPPGFITSSPPPPSIPASQPSQPCPPTSSHSTVSTNSSSSEQPFTHLHWLSYGIHSGIEPDPYLLHKCSCLWL